MSIKNFLDRVPKTDANNHDITYTSMNKEINLKRKSNIDIGSNEAINIGVTKDEEETGLDVIEHSASGYPDFTNVIIE